MKIYTFRKDKQAKLQERDRNWLWERSEMEEREIIDRMSADKWIQTGLVLQYGRPFSRVIHISNLNTSAIYPGGGENVSQIGSVLRAFQPP